MIWVRFVPRPPAAARAQGDARPTTRRLADAVERQTAEGPGRRAAGCRNAPTSRASARAARRARWRASRCALGQRLRLALAMIDAVGEDGYRETRVADVIARAGVSRKTFYELFDNKQDCLLFTYDVIVRRGDPAYRDGLAREPTAGPGASKRRSRRCSSSALENPGALRLSLLEIPARRPRGDRASRARRSPRFEAFIRDALELAPGEGAVSSMTLKAIIGGFNRVLYRRVLRGEPTELDALVPDLAALGGLLLPGARVDARRAVARCRARAARATLARRRPRARHAGAASAARRAARAGARRSERLAQLRRAEPARTDPRRGHQPDRRARATRRCAWKRSPSRRPSRWSPSTSSSPTRKTPSWSPSRSARTRRWRSVERAFVAQSDWRLAVRAGIAALFDFLATEPAFAHIALLDALVATEHTAQRSRVGVDAFAQMLAPGMEQTGGPAPPAGDGRGDRRRAVRSVPALRARRAGSASCPRRCRRRPTSRSRRFSAARRPRASRRTRPRAKRAAGESPRLAGARAGSSAPPARPARPSV